MAIGRCDLARPMVGAKILASGAILSVLGYSLAAATAQWASPA